MTSAQFQPQADTFAKPGIGEWLGRLLCWFAAFPYSAYSQFATPSLRAWVLVRGLAVIISPLVFTMALMSNAATLVGHTPYLYFLPVVVFAIDWFLVASTYMLDRSSGWLRFVRSAFFLISASMALFAGVLSESESLLRRLHWAEDAVTDRSVEAQNLGSRIQALSEQIARNEKELMTRDAIDGERLQWRKLEQLECAGKGGVDPETGIYIKGGGKCGTNASDHRIKAEAAEARLGKLTRLEEENHRLAGQRAQLQEELSRLREDRRSPAGSMGTLLRALLDEADIALWFRIVALFLCVMLTEMFAFILSEIRVAETMRTAVQFSEEIDQIRLQAWRDAELAEAARQRAARRAQAADDLAPLEVTLTPVAKPFDAAGGRNRVEEPAKVEVKTPEFT